MNKLFIAQKESYCKGIFVRGIFQTFQQWDGKNPDGSSKYKTGYQLIRIATTIKEHNPDHAMYWHSVRSGTPTRPFDRWPEELPEGAKEYPEKKPPRIGAKGLYKNHIDALKEKTP